MRHQSLKTEITGASVASNAVVNLVGQLIPLLVALFCIPIILSGLGVDRFGVLNLAWVIVGYFSILDFGLGRALTHLFASKSSTTSPAEVGQVAWLSIFAIAMLGVVGAFLVIIFAPWMVNKVFVIPQVIRSEALLSFYVLGLSVPLVMVSSGLRGMLEGLHQFKIVNMVRVPLGAFLYASPLLVLPFSHSLLYPVILVVVGRLLNLLVFLYFCNRFLPWREAKLGQAGVKGFSGLLRLGGWMTVSNTIGPLMVYMDRFLVGAMLSASAVAYYSTPYEVVTKLWIVPVALTGVLFPSFTHWSEDKDKSARLLSTSTRFVVLSIFPPTFILMAFSNEILTFWLGNEFAIESAMVLKWLAAGVFLNCIAQIPFTYLQSIGRPDVTAKAHVFELVFYLPAVIYMTKVLGIEGTAIAWVGRAVLDLLILLGAVRSLSQLNAMDTTLSVLLSVLVALMCFVSLPIPFVYRAMMVGIVLLGFVAIFWWYLLDGTERELLRNLVTLKKQIND